jgi:hypothetical protein
MKVKLTPYKREPTVEAQMDVMRFESFLRRHAGHDLAIRSGAAAAALCSCGERWEQESPAWLTVVARGVFEPGPVEA